MDEGRKVQVDAPVARVMEVIEVRFKRGVGIVGDPVRIVSQYRTHAGGLLAEYDPCARSSEPAGQPEDSPK